MLSPVLFSFLFAAAAPGRALAAKGGFDFDFMDSDFHWHEEDGSPKQCNNNPAGPLVPGPRATHCPLIVDDETDAATVSTSSNPWSYPPICVRRTAADPDSDEQTIIKNKLCTYTVTDLRGTGRGLSVITIPAVAAGLASNLQHPDIPWLEHRRRSPFVANPTKPYRVQEIPGKGAGVIATRPIPQDTVIMLELPVLLKISDTTPWSHGQDGLLLLMQQASKRLGWEDQNTLLQMARQGKGYILADIFSTNAFRVEVEGVDHSGIYPEIARINHECKPNCITRFSAETLAMEVVAYRDIQEGEELSLSYIPLNHPWHQRQHLVTSKWGFTCTCPLCKASAETRAASDRRRDNVDVILGGVRQRENITRRDRVQRAVGALEELVKAEGLSAQFGDLLVLIADSCLNVGDYELARKIGEQALRLQKRYAGVDNERSYQVERLLEVVDQFERQEGTGSVDQGKK